MKSLVKISYLKIASSTPWKYMARTRKVFHNALSGNKEEST